MAALVLGLIVFLGIHSTRIVAEGARQRFIAARGLNAWKGVYTVAAIAGLWLIGWGYGQARQQPIVLWPAPPLWVAHFSGLLVLIAFVLLVAAYVPGNGIKARLHHPMILGVKLWAFAHLIANNTLADVLLFGGFLAWAIADFAASRRRDRREHVVYPAGSAARSIVTVAIGVVFWIVFAFWAHERLIGVRPFG